MEILDRPSQTQHLWARGLGDHGLFGQMAGLGVLVGKPDACLCSSGMDIGRVGRIGLGTDSDRNIRGRARVPKRLRRIAAGVRVDGARHGAGRGINVFGGGGRDLPTRGDRGLRIGAATGVCPVYRFGLVRIVSKRAALSTMAWLGGLIQMKKPPQGTAFTQYFDCKLTRLRELQPLLAAHL